MFFVRLTTPLDVAPGEILGRCVVNPKDPLQELVPSPAGHIAESAQGSGGLHLLADPSSARDALLSNPEAGHDIAVALVRYGRLYHVEAARTEHGRIVELAYKVIISRGSLKDTNISRALKWLEDHRVPERALGAVVSVGITTVAPSVIGSVIGGVAGFIATDYVAPSVKSLLAKIASTGVNAKSDSAVEVSLIQPAGEKVGESGYKQHPVPYTVTMARAKL